MIRVSKTSANISGLSPGRRTPDRPNGVFEGAYRDAAARGASLGTRTAAYEDVPDLTRLIRPQALVPRLSRNAALTRARRSYDER